MKECPRTKSRDLEKIIAHEIVNKLNPYHTSKSVREVIEEFIYLLEEKKAKEKLSDREAYHFGKVICRFIDLKYHLSYLSSKMKVILTMKYI